MNKQLKTNVSSLSRYNSARSNLLLVIVFTFINIILAVSQSGAYLLFSASIPQTVALLGVVLYLEGSPVQVMISLVIVALVLLVPYLLFWIFSKKRWGWMIAALVYFAADFLCMLWLVDLQDMIIDVFFHAWVLYFLIAGAAAGKKAFQEKALSEAETALPDMAGVESIPTEDEYGYITSRRITLERSKSLAGSAVPYTCVFNQDGRQKVFQVERGKSVAIPASSSRYQIKISVGNNESEPFIGGEGADSRHYVIDSRFAFFKGMSFVIRQA